MKNNALKFVGLALIVPLMTACPKGKKDESNWSKEVQDAMVTYIGEVLPYVELNEETLTYGYDDSWGGFGLYQFLIYDDNETNVLEGYGDKLVAAGFEYTESEYEGEVYISYDKTNEVGFVSVDYKYEEATEETAAGNTISVSIPQYIDEEILLNQGYEKQTGFPTAVVEQTLEGSGITMNAVNPDGEWFVASNLYVDEENGSSYYCAYLVTKGDYFDAVAEDFAGQDLTYDEEYGCYYDASLATDVELYVSVVRGYTTFDLFGQTISPEVTSEEEQSDGSIDVSFTFAGTLNDGETFDNAGFESTSARVDFSKGGNGSNAPKYYDNGQTIRCYAKNTITISAASGLKINSVTLEVGSLKTLKPSDIGVSSGTVSATGTSAPATVTISGVNASTLTITVGPSASSGNIGFSSIKVNVSSAQ